MKIFIDSYNRLRRIKSSTFYFVYSMPYTMYIREANMGYDLVNLVTLRSDTLEDHRDWLAITRIFL